jgi:hypothetical protein
MNSKFISAIAVAAASPAAPTVRPANCADALISAANLLLTDLERGVAIDARVLRAAMIASFGASDAEGAWDWKTAYEACEAAQILFLRKFGPAMCERAASSTRFLTMLTKLQRELDDNESAQKRSQKEQDGSENPLGRARTPAGTRPHPHRTPRSSATTLRISTSTIPTHPGARAPDRWSTTAPSRRQ